MLFHLSSVCYDGNTEIRILPAHVGVPVVPAAVVICDWSGNERKRYILDRHKTKHRCLLKSRGYW